jgi:hypothetical protein
MLWQEILARMLAHLAASLDKEWAPWALIGSAATAVQGCAVQPNDLDFLAQAPGGVQRFAALLSAETPPICPVGADDEEWFSSQELPVRSGPDPYGFQWTFGRWYVDGFKVEMAHIVPPAKAALGYGIWEAGPGIWPHIRVVDWKGYQVPVVPLEIQLGTSLQRKLTTRVDAIVPVLWEQGFDDRLLRQSLTRAQYAKIAARLG